MLYKVSVSVLDLCAALRSPDRAVNYSCGYYSDRRKVIDRERERERERETEKDGECHEGRWGN